VIEYFSYGFLRCAVDDLHGKMKSDQRLVMLIVKESVIFSRCLLTGCLPYLVQLSIGFTDFSHQLYSMYWRYNYSSKGIHILLHFKLKIQSLSNLTIFLNISVKLQLICFCLIVMLSKST
jgi:hypothetical protein